VLNPSIRIIRFSNTGPPYSTALVPGATAATDGTLAVQTGLSYSTPLTASGAFTGVFNTAANATGAAGAVVASGRMPALTVNYVPSCFSPAPSPPVPLSPPPRSPPPLLPPPAASPPMTCAPARSPPALPPA
jgi:hypothetical protein